MARRRAGAGGDLGDPPVSRSRCVSRTRSPRRCAPRRHECGALDLETIEARPVTSSGGEVIDIEVTRKIALAT